MRNIGHIRIFLVIRNTSLNTNIYFLEDVMMRYPSSLVSLHLTDNKISQLDKFAFNGQTTLGTKNNNLLI